jgi:hypothetical protein
VLRIGAIRRHSLLYFSSRGIRETPRAERKKARMVNRVASDGTVLARSRCDEPSVINRNEEKK